MNKYTKLYTSNLDVYTKKIEKLKFIYKLLIANKHKSFRKELFTELDKLYFPTIGSTAWKQRFLYPEKAVPKKDFEANIGSMTDMAYRMLGKQIDYLKNLINNKEAEMQKISLKLKALEYKLQASEIELKNYAGYEKKVPCKDLQV